MFIHPFLARVLPPQQLEFVLRHELAHGIHNHGMWNLLALAVGIGSSIALPGWYKLLSIAAGGLCYIALQRSCEKEADKIAIHSMKTAAGAISFFDYALEGNKALRSQDIKSNSWLTHLWSYIVYTSDGEYRFDICHPSLADRKKTAKAIS